MDGDIRVMHSDVARKSAGLSDTQQLIKHAGKFVSRKIWLPKLVYDSLPYFYLAAGVSALFATLYIGNWMWVLPHYLLFSAACVHLGILIYGRRNYRRREDDTD